MTAVKICGITREADALLCADAGADFIGLVFAPGSKRRVDARQAADIARSVTGRVKLVGVFVDERPAAVRAIARRCRLDFVQLHGNEPEEDLAAAGIPSVRAVRIGAEPPTLTTTAAEWFLFDALVADAAGGTGRAFDWHLLRDVPRTKPFFLAGGITPGNVTEALRTVRPDAVDVSSGVELAPGLKDARKVRELITRVRAFDATREQESRSSAFGVMR